MKQMKALWVSMSTLLVIEDKVRSRLDLTAGFGWLCPFTTRIDLHCLTWWLIVLQGVTPSGIHVILCGYES